MNNSLGWPFEGPKDQQSSIFPLSRIRVLSVKDVASKRVVGDTRSMEITGHRLPVAFEVLTENAKKYQLIDLFAPKIPVTYQVPNRKMFIHKVMRSKQSGSVHGYHLLPSRFYSKKYLEGPNFLKKDLIK